jgi:GGDEF domain-containing protein
MTEEEPFGQMAFAVASTARERGQPASPAEAVHRARIALVRFSRFPDAMDDPLAVVALDLLRRSGVAVDLRFPLAALQANTRAHGRHNPRRYRWNLSWRAEPNSGAYRLANDTPRPKWRETEIERDTQSASAHGNRLMVPVVLAAQFDFWEGVASDPSTPTDVIESARALIDEAAPIAEDELARWYEARDPWRDTFGLWLLTASPAVMARFRHALFALAVRYGVIATGSGVVRGVRFPFYGRPLVSASAQLAGGLWRSGVYPTLIPRLVGYFAPLRESDGGWGDESQPPDILTTLAAADVLSRLDPDFDPSPTIGWFMRHQEPAGWWRALNPEVPWLTAAVADWIERCGQPFASRFEWPTPPIWQRDRLSGLATIGTLEELEKAIVDLPRLGAQRHEVAFIDLAGFGDWNTRYGQAKGDDVIQLLGKTLSELPDTLAVRIGGDEILLLGKPGDQPERLRKTVERWRHTWPDRLAGIDAHSVAPRVLVSTARFADLHDSRVALGLAIGPFKRQHATPPPEGVQGWD